MQIKAVIRYLGVLRVMHDTTFATLSEVIGSSDGRTHIILCCETDTSEIKYYDFSALIADQPIYVNNVKDWDTLTTYLNKIEGTVLAKFIVHCVVPEFLISKDGTSYTFTPNTFLSDQSKQLLIWSLDNNSGVTTHIGRHQYPGLLDKMALAHTLHDVVLINEGAAVNLKNSIPVINGIVCYPCFDQEDRMYATNGVFYLQKRNPVTTNSLLIDFSPFGELQCVRLSDCEKVSITGYDERETIATSSIIKGNNVLYDEEGTKIRDLKESECNNFYGAFRDIENYKYSDLTITFLGPEGVIGIPIVCIFGRIFSTLYDKVNYRIENNRLRVTLKVKRDQIYRILASNMVKSKQILKNSPVYQAYLKDNLDGLFEDKDEFLKDYYSSEVIDTIRKHRDLRDLCVPFLAVVTTERKFNMNFQAPTFKIDNENLMFKPNSGGILINKETLEIVDYMKIPFYDGTLCTFYHSDPLYSVFNDNRNEQLLETAYFKEKQKMYRSRVSMKDLHDTDNLRLMDFFYETEPEESTEPDIPPTPEPEEDHGRYIDLDPAELLVGYDRLIAGSKVKNVVITCITADHDKISISGILPEICGTYIAKVVEPNPADQIWYLDGDSSKASMYMKKNYWCIGYEGYDPIYQSSDAAKGIWPWYDGFLAWFVADTVNTDPEDDKTLAFKYISYNQLDITSGRAKTIGSYYLLDDETKFIERVWGRNTDSTATEKNYSIIFYDDDKNSWIVANDATVVTKTRTVYDEHDVGHEVTYQEVTDEGTRVYESSTAMHGSSPWHHLAYAYLLEE